MTGVLAVIPCIFFIFVQILGLFPDALALRTVTVDNEGKYNVSWEVYNSKDLQVELSVETTGFIGFGFSQNGAMAGADIFIGGVFENSTVYFSDRHGVGEFLPQIDVQQDWKVLNASENATHTYIKMTRPLNTCDETEDILITGDTIKFIWSYGSTDEIMYHGGNRGAYAVNALDLEFPPPDRTDQKVWDLRGTIRMPELDTVYMATTHQSPKFNWTKHHVVGFVPLIDNPDAYKHVHHLQINRCVAPEGVSDPDAFFQNYIGLGGGNMHDPNDRDKVPAEYCTRPLYSWAHGGRELVFPDDVGFPVGEGGTYEYYMMISHLDNPNVTKDLVFESGVKFYYTSNLREKDAGMIQMGHMLNSVGLLVPPQTSDFVIAGHCTPGCLTDLPESGLQIFNVMLHAHTSARKMKLRHFRNREELPWIINDNNYDGDYQENRNVNEVNLLKEDHVTLECTYNTNWKPIPGVVISGLRTEDEMCMAFVYYYPKLERTLEDCSSTYPQNNLFQRFGVENVTRVPGSIDPLILEPPSMFNLTFSQMLDTQVTWTDDLKNELREEIRFGDHEMFCYHIDGKKVETKVSYPEFETAYEKPLDTSCKSKPSAATIISLNISFLRFSIITLVLGFCNYNYN